MGATSHSQQVSVVQSGLTKDGTDGSTAMKINWDGDLPPLKKM